MGLACSPNSGLVAAAETDGRVHLLDVVTRSEVGWLQPPDWTESRDPIGKFVPSVAFSSDGKRLVAGASDRNRSVLHVWNVESRAFEGALSGHSWFILDAAFSPDDRWIVSVAGDGYNKAAYAEIFIWDAHTCARLFALDGPTANTWGTAFSPDSRVLATAHGDGTVILWNLATREKEKIFRGHQEMLTSVCFSPGGKFLATGSIDGTVRLWDAATGQQSLVGWHDRSVQCVGFSPDGKWLASGGYDQTVRLWEFADLTRRPVVLRGHAGGVLSLDFTPDSQTLASSSSDRTVKLWNVNTLRTDTLLRRRPTSLGFRFSPDGKFNGRFHLSSKQFPSSNEINDHFIIRSVASSSVVADLPQSGGRVAHHNGPVARSTSRLSAAIQFNAIMLGLVIVGVMAAAPHASAAPLVSRLTPPSALFNFNDPSPPIISRFLPGQRFDLQATVSPDAGQTISSVQFQVDGMTVPGTVSLTPATVAGKPAGAVVASLRAYASSAAGVHTLSVSAVQSDSQTVTASGNFEIQKILPTHLKARNIIILIGDGMGIAHRTAARIMLNGVALGKANAPLAMDTFPFTGTVKTHSLNSIVTDSSPGASCYATGNKANNNQHGVFPDDTTDNGDNPRVESIGEFLHRTQGRSLGLVTTTDAFDSTPAAFGSHTQARTAGTGIIDQFFDERSATGLKVLLGGGRKWFLPNTTAGSGRTTGTDYVVPADVAAAWGVGAGALDPARDLLSEFIADGFTYAPDATTLNAVPTSTTKLLGLFNLSNMNVSKDKIDKRRGASTVVDDFGFPDQPMLDEMTDKALEVLSKDRDGFVLMVEGGSIDKMAHLMDSERWILDTIEFDRAIKRCQEFAACHPDTLVIVTADHECAGANIIGASRVTHAELVTRAASGGGAAQLRNGVVGTLDQAGFPRYNILADGYPETTDIDFRMLVGYACNADRYEDWITNLLPMQNAAHGIATSPPLPGYPQNPLQRDTAGNFLITGHLQDQIATHTASDIVVSAYGRHAALFTGAMDNTDVFFRAMRVALGDAYVSRDIVNCVLRSVPIP
jgi:alkaline phosphatase